ncbi:MAG: 16S rRNA (cytidine(1402)-2'-O)-methyltransferase [Actinomycetota bacterium]
MAGTLFIVGTPIGNLQDLTDRARTTLAGVGLVAAEDTRRTGLLLQGLGIAVPMVSLFDANEAARTPKVIAALRDGIDVAIVSDGGMPLVSDPGFRVVRAVAEAGFEARVVPGPSAAIAALVVSGLPTDRWVFEGFLPKKPGDRRRRLEALCTEERTVVLFESPRRVGALLRAIIDVLGDRPVALCRELTKLHEATIRGPASVVAAAVGDAPLRGEVVLVVGGAADQAPADPAEAVAEARALVGAGARPRDAARTVARARSLSANEIYRLLLEPPA